MHALWTGHLKISLVALPVRLHAVRTDTEALHLHQLHKACGDRLRIAKRCEHCGPVDDDAEIVMGFEFERGRYVVLDADEIAAVRQATGSMIEVTQFAAAEEIPAPMRDASYWLVPDGAVALEAYTKSR